MISFGPFSAIYFAAYENLKNNASVAGDGKSLSFTQNLYCSSTAGAFASWITNPLDIAKLRLQIRRAGGDGGSGAGVTTVANPLDSTFGQVAHLWRTGGVRIFFKGALTRVLFHAPNTAVVVSHLSSQHLHNHNSLTNYHHHHHHHHHHHSHCVPGLATSFATDDQL